MVTTIDRLEKLAKELFSLIEELEKENVQLKDQLVKLEIEKNKPRKAAIEQMYPVKDQRYV